MKLVVDMNLSLRWVEFLSSKGHEARHWSSIGAADAPDSEVMASARRNGQIVITNDLDFGSLLAHSGDEGPSVVLLRAPILAPEVIGPRLAFCLEHFKTQLTAGAVLVVGDRKTKVRLLPIMKAPFPSR